MKLNDLKNKSILILGFGREGLATFNFLKQHFPDNRIAIADKSTLLSLKVGQAKLTYFGEDYLKDIENYDVIIKSPGVPNLEEIKDKTVISATDIFFDNFQGIIIGVTGTKGKSTTSSLIYEILKKAGKQVYLVGNIGVAPLDLLDKTDEKTIVVYELSSFQLEGLNISPHIAVITNIYPEHLDRHEGLSNYINAKGNITRYQTAEDFLIYNEDISEVKNIASGSIAQTLPFSNDRHDLVQFIDFSKVSVKGNANVLNIIAAVLVAEALKVPKMYVKEATENFSPLPHRLEFVAEKKKIKFYNDSLATNPHATIAGLQALGKDVQTIIVGGFDRGLDYSILGPAIINSGIKNVILFPDTGEKIWESVCKVEPCEANLPKKVDVSNMEQAVKIAYEVTDPGKIVLLSPAASSFNMFKNYEDRGNQFKKYILNYKYYANK